MFFKLAGVYASYSVNYYYMLFVQTDFNIRTVLTMPIGILLVFLNFIFLSSILGILAARFKDIDPTVKALMPPMLCLPRFCGNQRCLASFLILFILIHLLIS